MQLSKLNDQGYKISLEWMNSKRNLETVTPEDILWLQKKINNDGKEVIKYDVIQIDETKRFDSHFELGKYLYNLLDPKEVSDPSTHLLESQDSFWDWVTVIYLDQLMSDLKVREIGAYLCSEGRRSKRLYRHRCRTDYEMYALHKEISKLVLHSELHIGGEAREQLVATDWVRNSKPIFEIAYNLFFDLEKQVVKKNSSKNFRELKMWVERLDETYLIDRMSLKEMKTALGEFTETL